MSARSVCSGTLPSWFCSERAISGTAETPGDHDLHAARAGLHRTHDGLLHGAAERNALFELIDDVLSDQTRVEFGMLDLDDVDLNVFLREAFEVLADVFDADAALADDDAGLRRYGR